MTAILPVPHRFSENLNHIQYGAVTYSGGPLLVSAGPGTGKTRVLTHRVAWLLDQGASPSSILMLTFSCSAAQEMLTRAVKLAGRTKARLCGGTFHSVGQALLRRHGHHIGLPPNFSVLDRADSEDIIARLRLPHASVKGLPGRRDIMNLISAAASRMISVEELGCSPLAGRIAAEYASHKAAHSLLDFDDLLLFFHRLMAESETALEKINAEYQHILVDEYQDTNRIQAEIVRLLAPHGNVTAVGDEAQAVYSFRGADSASLSRFSQIFPGCAVAPLRHNYRSCSSVVAFSNAVMPGRDIYTEKTEGPLPLLIPAANDDSEAFRVGEKIASLLSEGFKPSEIAVLFRSEFHAAKLELEFVRRGIPYAKRGGKQKFHDAAHVKDMLAFFRVLLNPHDRPAWLRIFLQVDNVGDATADMLASTALSSDDPFAALNAVKPGAKWRGGWAVLLSLLNSVRTLERPCDIAEQAAFFVLPPHLRNHPDAPDKFRRRFERLTALLSTYHDLRHLVDDLSCAQPDEQEEEGISFYTIHAAKCREWRAVFVIGLAQGLFPDARVSAAQMDEERRLLYVAVTRAMERLFLSWPRRIVTADRRFMEAQMSVFLQDISPALYQTEGPPPF